jgi:threonine/homoserine/homoserine lactone efflux protein
MQSLTSFTVALLALLLVPGPTNTLLALSGATVGLYRSLHLLVYELIGYESAIAFIRMTIVPVIARLHGQTRFIRAVAAVYLVGLAVVLWRRQLDHATRVVRAHQIFITTLLNPKALIIGLVLIPVSPSAVVRYWLLLSATIPIVGGGWIYAGRFVGQAVPQKLATAIPRFGSLVLGAFAVVLIVSAVS